MEEKILSDVIPLSSIRTGCYNTALLCAVFRFKRDFRHFMLWDAASAEFRDKKFKMKLFNVFELNRLLDGIGLQIRSVPTAPESFVDTVCCCIDEECPVVAYMDLFAHSNFSATYQKIHSEHCVMLFGYERAEQVFHIVDHDYIEDFVYGKRRASFADMRDSFALYLTHYHPRAYVGAVGEVRCGNFAGIQDTLREYLACVTAPEHVENNRAAFACASEFLTEISRSEQDFLACADQYYVTTNSLFNKRMYEYQAFSRLFGERNPITDVLEPLLDRYNFVRSVMYKTKISHMYRNASSEKSAAAFAEIGLYEKQYTDALISAGNHMDMVKEFDYEEEVSVNGSVGVF